MDMNKIKEEAAQELLEERAKLAKSKIKDKLKQVHNAEIIVANLKRELEDIYAEIRDTNNT